MESTDGACSLVARYVSSISVVGVVHTLDVSLVDHEIVAIFAFGAYVISEGSSNAPAGLAIFPTSVGEEGVAAERDGHK